MSDSVRYPKPVELRRLGRRHAIVEAAAGTGKTYVLEHLIVDLLLRAGATLDQILIVTFTEKATTELTHRVRDKLAFGIVNRDDDAPRHAAFLAIAESKLRDGLRAQPALRQIRMRGVEILQREPERPARHADTQRQR